MRLHARFVVIVGVTYALLAEGMARTGWQPFRGTHALGWTLLASALFVTSTVLLARRVTRPWVATVAGNAGAAAGVGAALALTVVAFKVRWGMACNQCRPGLILVAGTLTAVMLAAFLAVPIGALTQLLASRFKAGSRAPAR